MLYDPKWEVETRAPAEVWSLPRLVAWLEKQPADVEYCYTSSGHCLIAQYLSNCGWKQPLVGGWVVCDWQGDQIDRALPPKFKRISQNEPRTFGAALERARALL